ncbi:AraC family transcriptional regulator [Paenibacillus silvae]|uniref:AraC family transcriptional regulator n=1 Tax=Paenibacillus silvae TaxID=1325358 RepID=UPI002005781F|nr:AraC family transcriptional regulator [Paenibacillus silvae]MCK6077317.1 AraC family transcriptional regulator [Paenibacillus silvae]MCK6151569.1 AraC family transcriptional regulator [Paenibacillus silvae]MCK6270003.1 AraC family transcriptional regulator [Paenibacillus silvae]
MQLDEQMKCWNQAAVKVLDIRRIVMETGAQLSSYSLPANGFIYTIRGSAQLQLDGQEHQAERFYMLHGAKGASLDIQANADFEYILLYYRAFLAFPRFRNKMLLAQPQAAPFSLQYGFTPSSPLGLLRYLSEMEKAWAQSTQLDLLHTKSLFYQFIHELMVQLYAQEVQTELADPVKQTIRYIQNHYREQVTLDMLAEQFNYSSRHLSMRFKRKTGHSPIDYLIKTRIGKARDLLVRSDATLGDIAAEVGYSDVYYFSRIFKKYVGLSPSLYQKMMRKKARTEDRPLHLSESSIGWTLKSRYIDYDNHYQYKDGGSTSMKSKKTSASMIMIALLSLTMLLAACSSGTAATRSAGESTGANSNSGNQAVTSETGSKVNKDNETRTVSTIKGDVIVPANPKRVVVLYLQGDVIALGVKPIATSDVYDGAAYKSELEGVNSLGTWFEPNPEAVIDLNPDLIIVPSEETYNILKNIAPTVYIPYEKMTTEERLHSIASIFGKEKEAEVLINDLNSKVEESKKTLADAGILDKTISIIEGGLKGMVVVESKQFGRGSQAVYEYLEMKAPKVVQDKIDVASEAAGSTISMEVLPEYVGDYVFRSVYDGADNLTDNPVWNSIPAVKEGRLIEIDFDFFYYSDIYSINKQLDFVVDKLLSAPTAR